ncbi:MAG: choice-of-anchor tandem repeat GloVer-containing protein [Opitutaceae bacterium]
MKTSSACWTSLRSALRGAGLLLASALCSTTTAFAQANVVLRIFSDPAENDTPVTALVQDAEGVLYGITNAGGANDRGTVYKLRPDGSGYGVLYAFTANPGNERYVNGKNNSWLLGSDGVLYGASRFGGANSGGFLFKLNRDGSGFTVLHSFAKNALGPSKDTIRMAVCSWPATASSTDVQASGAPTPPPARSGAAWFSK